jgi:hypothetical protein
MSGGPFVPAVDFPAMRDHTGGWCLRGLHHYTVSLRLGGSGHIRGRSGSVEGWGRIQARANSLKGK